MRILHVVTSFGLGGAESVAFQLAARHASAHEIHVQAVKGATGDSDPISLANIERLRGAGCRLHSGTRLGTAAGAVGAAASIAILNRRHRFDIVHSHTDIPDMSVSVALRMTRFAIVRTIHNTMLWPTRPRAALFCERAIKDDLVVAIGRDTEAAYLTLRARLSLPASRYRTIIPNAVESSGTLSQAGQRLAGQLAQSGKRKLLFLGRLEEQKGFDLLPACITHLLATTGHPVELHIVGDGSLRDSAVRLAAHFPDSVYFHGPIANASVLIPAFDLLLAPSRYEGMPLVALEALHSGVPAIVSDGPGMIEAYPADWGLRCRAGDGPSLAACLDTALAGLDSYKAQAQRLKETMVGYDADDMADSYMTGYRSYLSGIKVGQ